MFINNDLYSITQIYRRCAVEIIKIKLQIVIIYI